MLKATSSQELDQLALYGAARARADQRAWYMVQDTATGRFSLTPEPGRVTAWALLRVFRPPGQELATCAPLH